MKMKMKMGWKRK